MTYEIAVGLRYLKSRRRQTFISLISVISVGGVAVGVMVLIVVLAVMSGFETSLKTRFSASTRTFGFCPRPRGVSKATKTLWRVLRPCRTSPLLRHLPPTKSCWWQRDMWQGPLCVVLIPSAWTRWQI